MNRQLKHSCKGVFILALLSALTAGCAHRQPAEDKPVVASDVCSASRTLVCHKHRGKIYKCSCQSNDALREFLEPDQF